MSRKRRANRAFRRRAQTTQLVPNGRRVPFASKVVTTQADPFVPPSQRAYAEYLRSRHWWATRARTLLRWSGMCENCGVERATEVHHRNYERLGREEARDLAPLCSGCHALEHDSRSEQRRARPIRSETTGGQ